MNDTLIPLDPDAQHPTGWKHSIQTLIAADLDPVLCTTCNHPGAIKHTDELGVLIVHPGRDWLCRVYGKFESKEEVA